jgi:hypothetical protein
MERDISAAAELELNYFTGNAGTPINSFSTVDLAGAKLLEQGVNIASDAYLAMTVRDGSALKGFFWAVTAAGTFLGESVQVGDSIVAKVDNAGTNLSDWLILQGNVVIATDTVDGISRLATQTEANDGTESGAVVITPATLQGKIDAQVTPEINSKVSKSGDTMSGNLDMGGNDINNINNTRTSKLNVDEINSFTDFGKIDGGNLIKVAVGIGALGIAMAAFGAGSVVGGLATGLGSVINLFTGGGVIGQIQDTVAKLTPILPQLTALGPAINTYAQGIVAFGKAVNTVDIVKAEKLRSILKPTATEALQAVGTQMIQAVTKMAGGEASAGEKSHSEMQALNNTMKDLLKYMKDTAENTKRTHDATKALNGNLFAV